MPCINILLKRKIDLEIGKVFYIYDLFSLLEMMCCIQLLGVHGSLQYLLDIILTWLRQGRQQHVVILINVVIDAIKRLMIYFDISLH